ncbi:MAG TPA: aminotransferase class IV [Syntrophobacter fumaroxidans]|nr:aminotransferase class IV [Syntrophobacter fumaroxidans]
MNPQSPEHPGIVWLNGSFLPAGEAFVSPLDRGFLYGDGVFETMRAECGRVLYLRDHLERLHRSLAALRIRVSAAAPPDWGEVVRELLERAGLHRSVASVRITVTRGAGLSPGLPEASAPTLCVTARRYVPPVPSLHAEGFRLHVFRSGFSPPLAGMKTLNYLYFLCARQAALDAGADEALILDPEGRVAETSAGSLLARTDGRWWTPSSPFRLPGITIARVSDLLAARGHNVEPRTAPVEDLVSAQTLWILNSLMIVMPVRSLGEHHFSHPAHDEAAELAQRFIAAGGN